MQADYCSAQRFGLSFRFTRYFPLQLDKIHYLIVEPYVEK